MLENNKDEITDFGFQKVTKEEKKKMVANIFHSVATQYDVMNDLMSFGIHRIWKNLVIQCSGVRQGQKVLDVAGGTGDLTSKFSLLVGEKGEVVLVDINSSMLKVGREKLRNQGIIGNVSYVQANAEDLPFLDNIFDCVSISFGLRNIIEKNKALRSMYRVLKPNGQLLILEFSTPIFKNLSIFYDFYSFNILPKIGKIMGHATNSYRYLVESIRMHPNQEKLKLIILDAGFKNVEYFNMTGGIVAVHRGYKI